MRAAAEIEAVRLKNELEMDLKSIEVNEAYARCLAEQDNLELRHEYQIASMQWSTLQDTSRLLQWCLGRDTPADSPQDIKLTGIRVVGIHANNVAVFSVYGAQDGINTSFDEYDQFHVSSSGWLVGTGSYASPSPKGPKTFRDKLIEVPFKSVQLMTKSPSTLVLKILS